MSVDHVSRAVSPLAGTKPPTFLSVKAGGWVIVEGEQQVAQQFNDQWWMGQVVFCEGGARDPRVNTMFQVANVDDGCIKWVNGDVGTLILSKSPGRDCWCMAPKW